MEPFGVWAEWLRHAQLVSTLSNVTQDDFIPMDDLLPELLAEEFRHRDVESPTDALAGVMALAQMMGATIKRGAPGDER